MKYIKQRKTIRKYTAKDIDELLLNELIETACRTQTMGNLQLYSVVITRDRRMKERLSPIHFNQPMVENAPVVLTICADFRRVTDWCNYRKASPGYDNFLSFINASADALLFTQTFCNLAEQRGLGVCYLGTTAYMPNKIIDVLELPLLVMPIASLTIGWPDEEPAQSERLPVRAIIHDEVYRPYSPQQIDDYYGDKESLEINKEFVKINNKETLAQVFTDCRYTKENNEFFSKEFISALKRQGFM